MPRSENLVRFSVDSLVIGRRNLRRALDMRSWVEINVALP